MVTFVAPSRPERNDPCHCGSGKKYKRCCEEVDQAADAKARREAAAWRQFSNDQMTPEIEQIRRQADARQVGIQRQLADEYGVLINFVIPTESGVGKVWAIGSRVYTGAPANQTFQEFTLQVLRETLGEEWRAAQEAGGVESKHFLYRCFREYGAWTTRLSEQEEPGPDGVWGGAPNGWVQYLRSVAWDVVSLIHGTVSDLPEPLIARLRDPAAFQGARYELAIAGLFARLNCEVHFLDDDAMRSQKHVEFVARHRPSGQEFAVEAKSRHRPGVINQAGDFQADDPLRGDRRMVRKLFTKAMEKEVGDLPYFVFIDINAPIDGDADGEPGWQPEVKEWMSRFPVPTAEQPDKFNGLFVTNFSPQYEGDDLAQGGEWLCVMPMFVVNPSAVDITGPIAHALDRLAKIPEIGLDGTLR